jgi:hypothetical protein
LLAAEEGKDNFILAFLVLRALWKTLALEDINQRWEKVRTMVDLIYSTARNSRTGDEAILLLHRRSLFLVLGKNCFRRSIRISGWLPGFGLL